MADNGIDLLRPEVITEPNLSVAWGKALIHVYDNPGYKITPLIISLTGFDENGCAREDAKIRTAIDDFLLANKENGCFPVRSVAFTIFPQGYWLIAKGDRKKLYEIYNDALPHIKAKYPRLNNAGLYFERMISFEGARTNENQLEYMIDEYAAGRTRASKFQVTIYDPTVDQHIGPYQIFPCLQTVNFVMMNQGLVLNAFYAMQFLVRRAYGNLLGLCQLGAFMADAMNLPLVQVNMMAGTEKLDSTKKAAAGLVAAVRPSLPAE